MEIQRHDLTVLTATPELIFSGDACAETKFLNLQSSDESTTACSVQDGEILRHTLLVAVPKQHIVASTGNKRDNVLYILPVLMVQQLTRPEHSLSPQRCKKPVGKSSVCNGLVKQPDES